MLNVKKQKIKDMILKEKITNDMLVARKNGNVVHRNVLSVLLTELEKKEKESGRTTGDVTDSEILPIIKKLIESNILCKNEIENIYLECYLPTKMPDGELETVIRIVIGANNYTIKDMGKIMNYLSTSLPGQYDGKKASELIRKLLN